MPQQHERRAVFLVSSMCAAWFLPYHALPDRFAILRLHIRILAVRVPAQALEEARGGADGDDPHGPGALGPGGHGSLAGVAVAVPEVLRLLQGQLQQDQLARDLDASQVGWRAGACSEPVAWPQWRFAGRGDRLLSCLHQHAAFLTVPSLPTSPHALLSFSPLPFPQSTLGLPVASTQHYPPHLLPHLKRLQEVAFPFPPPPNGDAQLAQGANAATTSTSTGGAAGGGSSWPDRPLQRQLGVLGDLCRGAFGRLQRDVSPTMQLLARVGRGVVLDRGIETPLAHCCWRPDTLSAPRPA